MVTLQKTQEIDDTELMKTERKNGIHPRKQKKSEGFESNKKYLSERKELQGTEKVKSVIKKNGIKISGIEIGKIAEIPKEKRHNQRKSALKAEMKQYIIDQLTGEGEGSERCTSGIEEIGEKSLISGGKKLATSSAKTMGKWTWRIVVLILRLLLKLLKWLLVSLFSLLSTIITTFWPVLLVGLVICFVVISLVGTGLQIVSYIEAHVAAVEKEINEADEVDYYVHGGYYADEEDVRMNKDDMLLVFLAKAIEEKPEDSLEELEEQAPDKMAVIGGIGGTDSDFVINKDSEERIREEVLEKMLYYVKGSYEKEITVTVAPKPTEVPVVTSAITSTPEQTEDELKEVPEASPAPTPVPGQTAESTPAPTGTPMPSPVPTPTPVPETETITITVDTIDVHLYTAPEYIRDYSYEFTKEQIEMYEFLEKRFEASGYLPGNGATICDEYGNVGELEP